MTICVILMSVILGAKMAEKANLCTEGSWAMGTVDGSSSRAFACFSFSCCPALNSQCLTGGFCRFGTLMDCCAPSASVRGQLLPGFVVQVECLKRGL